MICPICLLEKPEKDFLKGQKECYRCIYKAKMKVVGDPVKKCKICTKILPRTRWIFCSVECSNKNDEIQQKAYWVRSIKVAKYTWN